MAEDAGLDQWARWLLGGRDAGFTDRQRDSQAAFLERVRDRILEGARLTSGDRVLDIGAGTGLVAGEAARRLGRTGDVVALDVSHNALSHCRARAPGLGYGVGDAVALPFADGSFDVAVSRSVLIYVDDKLTAAAEIRRVLRPGGRLALFEPVNAAGRGLGIVDDEDVPEPLRPEHALVADRFRAMSLHWAPMMDFDERDLVRSFTAVGFDAVGLEYELLVTRQSISREAVERSFEMRGNPTAPTWREAAVAALGADAGHYLTGLAHARAGRSRTVAFANAFLTATG